MKKYLMSIGFNPASHFTVMDSLIYDLGRSRYLSASNVGSPNEMVFICESNENDKKRVDDLICVHNFDYDGWLTKERINAIIYGITGKIINP